MVNRRSRLIGGATLSFLTLIAWQQRAVLFPTGRALPVTNRSCAAARQFLRVISPPVRRDGR